MLDEEAIFELSITIACARIVRNFILFYFIQRSHLLYEHMMTQRGLNGSNESHL